MKLIYKEKSYTLDELYEAERSFENNLEGYDYLLATEFFEFVCLDPGYKLAVDLFRDLYSQISSARYALLLGFKKLHDSNNIKWNSGEIGQYWLRFQYLKNSIIWYNSCFDLLIQIPWFLYSLYKVLDYKQKSSIIEEIDSDEIFNILQNKCRYDNLRKALSIVGTKDANEMERRIKEFYEKPIRKEINKWANSLKHHGRFGISELHRPGIGLIVGTYNSEFTKPLIVDIDYIISELNDYHNALAQLIQFIFKFSNVDELIELQKSKKIPFNTQEEKSLKRIRLYNSN